MVHHNAPKAVDLLNEQLVELGREACSRLSISGSQASSDISESIIDNASNEQKAPATSKTLLRKVDTLVSVNNRDPTSISQIENKKIAPPSYPFPIMSSHIPCSNPASHSYPVITTAKDVDPFYNNESYNPISYTRDVNEVSIVPPKGDHAYNILHAVPFDDSYTTPTRCLLKS